MNQEWIKSLSPSDTILLLEACTHTSSYGISKKLSEWLPYSNHIDRREGMSYVKSRAHWNHRDKVGDVKLCVDPASLGPNVVFLLHAFAPGKAYENNEYRQELTEKTRDWQYAKGLKCDTTENRLESFKKCMQTLEDRQVLVGTNRCIFIVSITQREFESGTTHQGRYIPLLEEFLARYPYVEFHTLFKPECKPQEDCKTVSSYNHQFSHVEDKNHLIIDCAEYKRKKLAM